MRTERNRDGKLIEIYSSWEEFYKMHPNVKNTLAERQHTHGEFTDNARVMQALKDIVRTGENWPRHVSLTPIKELSPVQRETIDMILLKISRIVTGNPNEPDHWLDIEGYARLARERLEK